MAARERVRTWRPLLVLGILLITYGSLVAVLVGSDESVAIDTHSLPTPARGVAVATHPVLTAFQDVDLEVTVSAPGGVFLAAGRRVDTVSLLAERTHYELSRMSFGDVNGRMHEAGPRADFATLRPDRIVGWAFVSPDNAAGPGASGERVFPTQASFVVPLGDEPLDVVAFPVSPDDALSVTLGVHSAGAFTLHVALAVAGAVLVVLWWVLRRRGRRRASAVVVSAAALGLAATGCAVPSALPTTDVAPTRVALTDAEAVEVLGDAPGDALDRAPLAVHAVAFDQYPMWAVVHLPAVGDGRRTRLVVLSRGAFAQPWKRVGAVRASVAPPPPGNPRAVVTESTRRAAVDAGDALAEFWMTGRKAKGLRLDAGTRAGRAALTRAVQQRGDDVWVLGGAGGDVRVAPVVGGHLALISQELHDPHPRRLTSAVMLREGRRAEVLGSTLASPAKWTPES